MPGIAKVWRSISDCDTKIVMCKNWLSTLEIVYLSWLGYKYLGYDFDPHAVQDALRCIIQSIAIEYCCTCLYKVLRCTCEYFMCIYLYTS